MEVASALVLPAVLPCRVPTGRGYGKVIPTHPKPVQALLPETRGQSSNVSTSLLFGGASLLAVRRALRTRSWKGAEQMRRLAGQKQFVEAADGATKMTPPLRVTIVGAGPGGLALACAFARMENMQVTVVEGRPRKLQKTIRSHTIGLGLRARDALVELGGRGLWDEVSQRGMEATGFSLQFNGFPLKVPTPTEDRVVLVDRFEIVSAIHDYLERIPRGEGTEILQKYDTQVSSVNFAKRELTLSRRSRPEETETLNYDVLIGADGVRSRVRKAMGSQLPPGNFEAELRLKPGRWKVLHMDLPPSFERGAVHALVSSRAPFGLFCIPNATGPYCVIVSWSSEEPPSELLGAQTPQEFEALLLRYFPKLEAVPHDVAAGFLESQPSKAVVSRCRPLHNAEAAVCVMGDAAHAVGGGSLGQGCSAALMDAAVLAKCFSKVRFQVDAVTGSMSFNSKEVDKALFAFSESRADDGWALLDLIELQSAAEVNANALLGQGPLVIGFFIEQLGRGVIKPLADVGARVLEQRLEGNQKASQEGVENFTEHLKMRPTTNFSAAVLLFIFERAVLRLSRFFLGLFTGLQPPMQTALMKTDESYSQIVQRNQTWLDLLQNGKSPILPVSKKMVRQVEALSELPDSLAALWATGFTARQVLKDDVIVRQNSPCDTFYAIHSGCCRVLHNGSEVTTLGPGRSVGAVGLLLGMPSQVTMEATNDTTLLTMPGRTFQLLAELGGPELRRLLTRGAEDAGFGPEVVAQAQEVGLKQVKERLEQSTIATEKKDFDIDGVLESAFCEMYSEGEVVALGCPRPRLLEQGLLSVVRAGKEVRSLMPGDWFGEDLQPNERIVVKSNEAFVCSFSEDDRNTLENLRVSMSSKILG